MLKSIRDIWFGCSQEVGCFSEGLLREVLLEYTQHYPIIKHGLFINGIVLTN